ncbi:MAG: hypothetical protein LUF79_08270 [Enterococcus sp.]|nr:hypothetical protein [Enterococcus sp.]
MFDHKADAPKAGQRQADVKEGDDACSDEGNAVSAVLMTKRFWAPMGAR